MLWMFLVACGSDPVPEKTEKKEENTKEVAELELRFQPLKVRRLELKGMDLDPNSRQQYPSLNRTVEYKKKDGWKQTWSVQDFSKHSVWLVAEGSKKYPVLITREKIEKKEYRDLYTEIVDLKREARGANKKKKNLSCLSTNVF